MGDDFQGTKWITLEPNDSGVPYSFTITASSSTTANDGFIPYGTNVNSVSAKAYDSNSNDVTSEMVNGTPAVDNNVITVNLDYPSTSGTGVYKLTLILTLNTGSVIEADFIRIRAEDT